MWRKADSAILYHALWHDKGIKTSGKAKHRQPSRAFWGLVMYLQSAAWGIQPSTFGLVDDPLYLQRLSCPKAVFLTWQCEQSLFRNHVKYCKHPPKLGRDRLCYIFTANGARKLVFFTARISNEILYLWHFLLEVEMLNMFQIFNSHPVSYLDWFFFCCCFKVIMGWW